MFKQTSQKVLILAIICGLTIQFGWGNLALSNNNNWTAGDVDGNGHVQTYDAALILKGKVSIPDLEC